MNFSETNEVILRLMYKYTCTDCEAGRLIPVADIEVMECSMNWVYCLYSDQLLNLSRLNLYSGLTFVLSNYVSLFDSFSAASCTGNSSKGSFKVSGRMCFAMMNCSS